MKRVFIAFTILIISSCQSVSRKNVQLPPPEYNLKFSELAESWDEAIPLGNGMLGALIWQKEGKLRISLDRADLWDLRPMENLDRPEWKFSWVKEQWKKETYSKVQQMFDLPYDQNPAPSKIPGGALEFDISSLGEVESVELILRTALCEIKWKNGTSLQIFINAENQAGWFRFNNTTTKIIPDLIEPAYNLEGESGEDSQVTGQDLRRLGYPKGEIIKTNNSVSYNQKGWGGFQYQINVRWKENNDVVEGCWSIDSESPGWEKQKKAETQTVEAMKDGFSSQLGKHIKWWKNFWSQSDITIPDTLLNKQWYLEIYKLGAATGNGAPPISLQAIWTADNGKLPPWKGDFHNDLNTQLSYWPAYSSNHLKQETGFMDWLLKKQARI
jgi:alpha-L-fucosidase 2